MDDTQYNCQIKCVVLTQLLVDCTVQWPYNVSDQVEKCIFKILKLRMSGQQTLVAFVLIMRNRFTKENRDCIKDETSEFALPFHWLYEFCTYYSD